MATEVLMPKLGLTMTEGTIDEWKKNVGDTVKKGEILFSVETDKLTNDVEAEADGVLLKILVPAGETVACKTLVGWLGAAGEAVPDGVSAAAPAAAPAARLRPQRLQLQRQPRRSQQPEKRAASWWWAAAPAVMSRRSVPHSWAPR